MSLIPNASFPTRTTAPNADYPYGGAQNVTAPNDGTGTPWIADIINDIFGFQQALLVAAGIAPSGNPDTAQDSQYLDALLQIIADNGGWPRNYTTHSGPALAIGFDSDAWGGTMRILSNATLFLGNNSDIPNGAWIEYLLDPGVSVTLNYPFPDVTVTGGNVFAASGTVITKSFRMYHLKFEPFDSRYRFVWVNDSSPVDPSTLLDLACTRYLTGILRIDAANGDHARIGHGRVISGSNLVEYAYGSDGSGASQGTYGGRVSLGSNFASLNSDGTPTSQVFLNNTSARLQGPEVTLRHLANTVFRSLLPSAGGGRLNNTLTGTGEERIMTESDLDTRLALDGSNFMDGTTRLHEFLAAIASATAVDFFITDGAGAPAGAPILSFQAGSLTARHSGGASLFQASSSGFEYYPAAGPRAFWSNTSAAWSFQTFHAGGGSQFSVDDTGLHFAALTGPMLFAADATHMRYTSPSGNAVVTADDAAIQLRTEDYLLRDSSGTSVADFAVGASSFNGTLTAHNHTSGLPEDVLTTGDLPPAFGAISGFLNQGGNYYRRIETNSFGSLDLNITTIPDDNAWRTVGATGSGADIEWAALDALPDGVYAIDIFCAMFANTTNIANNSAWLEIVRNNDAHSSLEYRKCEVTMRTITDTYSDKRQSSLPCFTANGVGAGDGSYRFKIRVGVSSTADTTITFGELILVGFHAG